MDSITHIALGACMGEAFAGKTLGKKAMLWGALAQSIPDIDFVASLWLKTPLNLLAHRGFTHSFLFCAMVSVLLALWANRMHRPHNISLQKWLCFFGVVIFIHIFIDAFNNYGVGWWEPFSHQRISFNAIYVVDPFFSVGPGVAMVALIVLKNKNKWRKNWYRLGLGFSVAYLLFCVINKIKIDNAIKNILQKQGIPYTRYFTTPAPLQNVLWYVVAGTDSGYYIGFRSLLDSKKEINFQHFNTNNFLLYPYKNSLEVEQLIRFSQKFYTVEKWGDTTVFNDLRFGQILGWQNAKGKFVFHYFIQHPNDNTLVVQRGRFLGWNKKSLLFLWRRIRGN